MSIEFVELPRIPPNTDLIAVEDDGGRIVDYMEFPRDTVITRTQAEAIAKILNNRTVA